MRMDKLAHKQDELEQLLADLETAEAGPSNSFAQELQIKLQNMETKSASKWQILFDFKLYKVGLIATCLITLVLTLVTVSPRLGSQDALITRILAANPQFAPDIYRTANYFESETKIKLGAASLICPQFIDFSIPYFFSLQFDEKVLGEELTLSAYTYNKSNETPAPGFIIDQPVKKRILVDSKGKLLNFELEDISKSVQTRYEYYGGSYALLSSAYSLTLDKLQEAISSAKGKTGAAFTQELQYFQDKIYPDNLEVSDRDGKLIIGQVTDMGKMCKNEKHVRINYYVVDPHKLVILEKRMYLDTLEEKNLIYSSTADYEFKQVAFDTVADKFTAPVFGVPLRIVAFSEIAPIPSITQEDKDKLVQAKKEILIPDTSNMLSFMISLNSSRRYESDEVMSLFFSEEFMPSKVTQAHQPQYQKDLEAYNYNFKLNPNEYTHTSINAHTSGLTRPRYWWEDEDNGNHVTNRTVKVNNEEVPAKLIETRFPKQHISLSELVAGKASLDCFEAKADCNVDYTLAFSYKGMDYAIHTMAYPEILTMSFYTKSNWTEAEADAILGGKAWGPFLEFEDFYRAHGQEPPGPWQ